jgi:hypothetical protein
MDLLRPMILAPIVKKFREVLTQAYTDYHRNSITWDETVERRKGNGKIKLGGMGYWKGSSVYSGKTNTSSGSIFNKNQ